MGLGPNQTSLLNKLGFKQAWEMSDDELQAIVAKDQIRRTSERALGRAQKVTVEEDDNGIYHLSTKPKKVGRPRTKSRVKANQQQRTLESCGLAPALCAKLRQSGKEDWQLILEMEAAGLI